MEPLNCRILLVPDDVAYPYFYLTECGNYLVNPGRLHKTYLTLTLTLTNLMKTKVIPTYARVTVECYKKMEAPSN